jgi:hypothetical protein
MLYVVWFTALLLPSCLGSFICYLDLVIFVPYGLGGSGWETGNVEYITFNRNKKWSFTVLTILS